MSEQVNPQRVWLQDGFGGGEHVYVYRASDYAALEAECERLADELDRKSVITYDYIARCQRLAAERDKLAQALGNVEREHDLIRQMKNCEIHRSRGSFGIAVMSDPLALDWQALDKELQQLIDARRTALPAQYEGGA